MNGHSQFFMKCVASILIAVTLTQPMMAMADVRRDMNNFFNDLGVASNVTQPGAFRGQAMNTYTAGNLFLRTPTKTYTMASVQWPSVAAGCNGIDAFAGSFSHISSDQLKDMLKKITSSLPGVAFQLALSSVSPLLGEKTQWMQTIEQALTRGHINSCETATALVKSAASAMNFDQAATCRRAAIAMGLAGDEAEAARRCQQDANAIVNQARSSSDPSIAALPPFVGNLMWEALSRLNTRGELDNASKLLVMSLTGTIVYKDPATTDASGAAPEHFAPTIASIKDLLYGTTAADASGDSTVPIYSCNTASRCTNVAIDTNQRFTPLVKLVENRMNSLAEKIRSRGTPTPEEIGFVNSVTEPVFRILSVGNTVDGSGMSDQLIAQYRDVIAIDFAHTFLERSLRVGLNSLGNNYQLDKTQREDEALLRSRITDALKFLADEKRSAYEKVRSFNSIAGHLAQIESNLRQNLPEHIQDMIGRKRGSEVSR
jgi:conjugative transfer pilus assembly protein TraH